MDDNERRAWSNLILLCTPHHNMIDKIKPADYPISELEKWKAQRETGGLARLKGLRDLTEDRLQEMLADSMKKALAEIEQMLEQNKPIDPDAAMLLSEAADKLNMTTAETLWQASSMLAPALNEYAEQIYYAARHLAPALDEHAVLISSLSDVLPSLLEQLDERIFELRRLQGEMLWGKSRF